MRISDELNRFEKGLCRVAGLTEQEVGGVRAAYYQLEPRRGGKVLVPTGSETLTKRIRPALSAAEADEHEEDGNR